jgi:Ni/Fe-hydrogenase subunit HybB-like protein
MPLNEQRLTADLLKPLQRTSAIWFAWVLFLVAIVGAGAVGFAYQTWQGFGITGIKWPIYWGFFITNFVFWIGISHAGTLISAILRMVQAEWRRPVTRCAEVITAFALMIGGLFPIIHLGKPWLFFWLVPYPSSRLIWPNFRSPLVWDFFAISTYLTGSLLFLLLPMIPDFAIVRDHSAGMRKKIYGLLALGWRGTTAQWHRLETAMQIMAVAIIPVAVSVHTIVSFDFSMAPVPMWHSTIFGPYFVAGAIFSGIAGLILAMATLRKFLHLEPYLKPIHFDNLGKLLLTMSLLWGYFTFNERLTVWYGNGEAEVNAFMATQKGAFAPLYWTMVVCNFVVPVVLLGIRRLRRIPTMVIASLCVCVGMWLERFLIVVPSLGHKNLPYSWSYYVPRPNELFITVATFAAMMLLYTLFAKFVPIISIWEMKAGDHQPPASETEPTHAVAEHRLEETTA